MIARGWLSTLFELRRLYNGPAQGCWCLAPGACLICGNRCDREALCVPCIEDLPRRAQAKVQRKIPGVGAAFALFHYAFPVTHLIKAAKFAGDLCALDALAARLVVEIKPLLHDVDYVVPIPLAPGRYVMRGFNQAIELAQPLAAALDRPLRCDCVRRVHSHTAQSSLTAAARRDNVREAFAVRADVAGKTVLLVDDVITTGATLAAVATVLRRCGAAEVFAVAIAATPLRRSPQVSRLVTVRA